jgi:hypothetical protein
MESKGSSKSVIVVLLLEHNVYEKLFPLYLHVVLPININKSF